MNKIINYFDLVSELRHDTAYAVSEEKKLHWIPQYVALLLGIAVQPFFQQYMDTGTWEIKGLLPWLVAAFIIGLMAFPAVYKNSFDPTKPLFVQLCVIFTSGMGWQGIVSIAQQAT